MTLTELEQRVLALEIEVAQLKRRLSRISDPPAAAGDTAEEEIIPGVEYPLVLDVPPHEVFSFRGRILSVEEGHHEFGLSPEEWASLSGWD
jgi:hypothetical protein